MAKKEEGVQDTNEQVLAGLNALTSLLQAQGQRVEDLAGQVGNVSQRLLEIESKQPKFQPMQRQPRDPREGTYQQSEEIRARGMSSLKKVGQQVGGRLSNDTETMIGILAGLGMAPAFQEGDQVRINGDAIQFGSVTDFDYRDNPYPQGRTWREVLEERRQLRVLDLVGEVLRVERITPSYEPKYKVRIPGFTPPEGDGFRESELIWADY